MAYKLIVSVRAQREIENAIDYYSLYSYEAPKKIIEALQDGYDSLSINPLQRIRYKNIRSFTLKVFPHCLYFTFNEKTQTVKVLACFHNKRNPLKRPR